MNDTFEVFDTERFWKVTCTGPQTDSEDCLEFDPSVLRFCFVKSDRTKMSVLFWPSSDLHRRRKVVTQPWLPFQPGKMADPEKRGAVAKARKSVFCVVVVFFFWCFLHFGWCMVIFHPTWGYLRKHLSGDNFGKPWSEQGKDRPLWV